jgi:hypothetical protein
MPPIDTVTARPFSEHVPATEYAAWLAEVIAAGAAMVTVGFTVSLVVVPLVVVELPSASVSVTETATEPSVSPASVVGAAVYVPEAQLVLPETVAPETRLKLTVLPPVSQLPVKL